MSRDKPLHYSGTEVARVVQTPLMRRVGQAVDSLSGHRGIILVDGEAGVGKTFAVDYSAEQAGLPIYWLDLTGETSVLNMFGRLIQAITGEFPKRQPLFGMSYEVEELLTAAECVLVVDEAQWAEKRLLRVLRSIYDHADAERFILCLVGYGAARSIRAKEPGLDSRISRRVDATQLRTKDIPSTLAEYHPLFAATDPTLLAKLADHCRGNWRNWAVVLEAALATGMDETKGLLPRDVTALQRLIGSSSAHKAVGA